MKKGITLGIMALLILSVGVIAGEKFSPKTSYISVDLLEANDVIIYDDLYTLGNNRFDGNIFEYGEAYIDDDIAYDGNITCNGVTFQVNNGRILQN